MSAPAAGGWRATKFKFVGDIVAGGTPDSGNPAYWDGPVPWLTPVDLGKNGSDALSGSERTLTSVGVKAAGLDILPSGSIVISTRAPIGSVGLLACEATTNQGCKAIVPVARELDSKFAYYLATDTAPHLQSLGLGTTFHELSTHALKNVPLQLPSIQEQRFIAKYLDEHTEKIDRLIRLRRRQMELLREQREALIQHAVTRGIDSHAALKMSGIPWIGDVPAHWAVKRLKFVTLRVDVGIAEAATHAYADAGVPIVRSTNVRPNHLEVNDLLFLEPWFAEKNRSKYLFAGDLVTTRTGNAGVSAVVPEELDRCQCFTMLISTLVKNQSPDYFCYLLNSKSGGAYFQSAAWGAAQDNISVPILKNMPIVEPPLREQLAIVQYIRQESAKLDYLNSSYARQLVLLEEHRAALIHESVTGRRRVG